MRTLLKSSVSVVVIAGLWSSIAAAQTVPEEEAIVLDTVTVEGDRAITATKTDTPLIETPQAISVIPAQEFNDRGALTAQETLRYSAGVEAEQYGLDTRNDQPVARGFSLGQYQDRLVKFIGGTLVPRTEPFTLERVELLRGPSSALYGQGPAGGVLNMISKRPEFDSFGEVGLQYGSFDRFQGQLDLNGVLNDQGTVAGRLTVVGRDSGMQTDEIADDRWVVAPSITWQPDSDTSISFLGLWQQDRTASSQQFLPVVATLHASANQPRLDDSTFLGEPGFDKLNADQTSATLLVTHRFAPEVTFNSAVRFVHASVDFNEIYPDVFSDPDDPFLTNPDDPSDTRKRFLNRFAYSSTSDIDIWTTDNNLAFAIETGPVSQTLLVGIDYQTSDLSQATGDALIDLDGDTIGDPIDAYDPVYGNFNRPALSLLTELNQSQIGIYIQDQIRLYEKLNIVLGIRRDRATNQVEGNEEQVDEATSYRAGVIYDIGYGLSPYVSYTESFQPILGVDNNGNPFKPLEGRQYETGVKWEPLEGALISVAAYQLTQTNQPTNDPEDVLNTVQTGESESKGVELEASYTVPGNITLTAAFSRSTTKVTESNFSVEVGRQLNDTPRTLASAWAVKTIELADEIDLRLGAGVRYVGETASRWNDGVAATPDFLTTPDFTLVDALVAVDYQDWSVSVNATNLFDESYYTSCRVFGDCFTGNRRNVIATVTRRF